MQISTDGYVFDFAGDVIDAFVFDSPEHNGMRHVMRCVDIIAEFPDEFLFIELKKYDPEHGGIEFSCPIWGDKSLIIEKCPLATNEEKRVKASVKRIAHDLRCKYCDTFMYRYAEDRIGKQVNFICLVEGCEAAQTLRLNEILNQTMPKGKPGRTHWVKPIVKNVAVVNVAAWNNSEKLSRYGSCALTV